VYLFDRWNTKRQNKEFPEAKPGYHPLLFWGPALCDVFATSIMYFGLLFISSSVYQMMRGLVVLFVCMVSKFVLKKSYPAFKWLGVVCILSGAAIVGVVAIAYTPSDGGSNQQAFGVACVIIAVFIQAVQVTLEEKYVARLPQCIFVTCCPGISTHGSECECRDPSVKNRLCCYFPHPNRHPSCSFPPLQVVGLEGFFGIISLSLILMYAPTHPAIFPNLL
jgi:drug/metabolite transporter (DMT)-like permease